MSYELSRKGKMAVAQRIAEHEDQQFEERRQQTARDMENTNARNRRIAAEEAAKDEKRKLDDIAIDQELEPKKQILLRDWLANHPGKSSTEFERLAWPHLRANLIAEQTAASVDATVNQMRSTYSSMI